MVTEKEKLYAKARKKVEDLISNEGLTLTAARNLVALKMGLSYPTVMRLTQDLGGEKAWIRQFDR